MRYASEVIRLPYLYSHIIRHPKKNKNKDKKIRKGKKISPRKPGSVF
jgi:hypothetical protein